MGAADFDLNALYHALDAARGARELSWTAAAREINRFKTGGHPIAVSTLTGLETRDNGEGDGILQMLLWLRRSPESFIPDFPDADAGRYQLGQVPQEQILRWDARALHAALDARRQERGLSWRAVAEEIGGFTAPMLTRMAKGGRVGFPRVMRIVRWLDAPAVTFTVASPF